MLSDTGVAIELTDRAGAAELLRSRGDALHLSAVSRVESENGVYRDPRWADVRRANLDALLAYVPTLPFADQAISEYERIVSTIGYSRPRVIDRMIAATALVHDLPVATLNPKDFRDVPGLTLAPWPST